MDPDRGSKTHEGRTGLTVQLVGSLASGIAALAGMFAAASTLTGIRSFVANNLTSPALIVPSVGIGLAALILVTLAFLKRQEHRRQAHVQHLKRMEIQFFTKVSSDLDQMLSSSQVK